MEEIKEFVHRHQSIIGAVIAGTCAIIAAIIRRDKTVRPGHHKKPIIRLVLFSLGSLVVGGALLAAEFFVLPFDPSNRVIHDNIAATTGAATDPIPEGARSLDPGSILLLAGWFFITAGVVWLFINLIRLRRAHQKGKELASVPVSTPATAAPAKAKT